MFHIFSKKRFLVDALEGFVDIHNHILPGIDDGAKTVEDSVAMIREFESFGVTHFIATPHIMNDYYPNTPESIENAYNLLKSELLRTGKEHIAIKAAAEHMIDGTFETLLEKDKIMPFPSQFLLVEMSYIQPAINFNSAILKCAEKGYFTILAHPERYYYFHQVPEKYREFKSLGVQFQMNLLSLGDYYGTSISKTAYKLLDSGSYEYLGTDAHSLAHLKAIKQIQVSERTIQKLLPVINNTIKSFY